MAAAVAPACCRRSRPPWVFYLLPPSGYPVARGRPVILAAFLPRLSARPRQQYSCSCCFPGGHNGELRTGRRPGNKNPSVSVRNLGRTGAKAFPCPRHRQKRRATSGWRSVRLAFHCPGQRRAGPVMHQAGGWCLRLQMYAPRGRRQATWPFPPDRSADCRCRVLYGSCCPSVPTACGAFPFPQTSRYNLRRCCRWCRRDVGDFHRHGMRGILGLPRGLSSAICFHHRSQRVKASSSTASSAFVGGDGGRISGMRRGSAVGGALNATKANPST